ncbi:MAG: hypothetical protein P8Y42_22075 [Exilibacterium sp.]
MPAYSDTSPSGRSSGVPQPIDFGGSASAYSGASQSRHTSVSPIEYGSASQSGGATGSSASQRTSTRRGRYSDEEKSKAISAWQVSKETQPAFSKRTGIPLRTLQKWIGQAKVSVPSQRNNYTPEEKSRALSDLQASKETQPAFSKRTGIPIRTLQNWIRQAEGSVPRQHIYTPEEKSRALSDWQASKEMETQEAFSERTGIPVGTLQNWIKKEKDSSKGAR